jgi:GH24 family phage-related lysozyme (muramidase)
MTDPSAYSDAEILSMAGLSGGSAEPDYSAYSDSDILQMAGIQAAQPQLQGPSEAFTGGITNILSGLTFGLGDEILGGVSAPVASIASLFTDNPMGIGEAYDTTKGMLSDDQSRFREENPWTALLGTLAGGAKIPLPNVFSSGKGLKTAGANIAKGTGLGALFGGLTGFGEGEGTQERLTGAASGMGVGGATGGVLTGGVQGLQGLYRLGQGGLNSIKSFLNPNIASEADDLARATLGQFTNVDELAGLLKAPIADDILTANKRTAEIVQDPGLALLTKTLEKTIPEANTVGLAKDLARESARREIIDLTQGAIPSKELAGKIIRDGLAQNKTTITKAIDAQYDIAKASEGFASIKPIKESVRNIIKQQSEYGILPDSSAQKFLKKFNDLPDEIPFPKIIAYREKAGQLIGDYRNSLSKTPEQNAGMGALKTLFGGLDEAEKVAVKQGSNEIVKKLFAGQKVMRGVSAEEATAITEGRKLVAQKGDSFGKGAAGAILKQDQYKQYKLPSSKVLNKVFAGPEEARQVVNSLKNQTKSKEALQAGLIETFKNAKGVFTRAQFSNNWKKIKPVADEILTPLQIRAISRVEKDLVSRARFDEIAQNASKGNSVTAQSEGAAGIIKGLITQRAKNKSGILGRFFESIGEKKALEVKEAADEVLVKMAFDPKYAKDFLSKPTPEIVEKISKGFIGKLNTPLRLIGQQIGSSTAQKSEEKRTSQNNTLPGTQVKQSSFNSKLDSALTQAEKEISMKTPEIIEAKRVSTSSKADKFLEKEEGGQILKAYNPPAKGSGITVSTGVDLGQHSRKDLEKMGVSEKTIFKVEKYLGAKDATARKLLKEKPLTLTKAEADELDSAMEQDIFGTVEKKLKDKGVTLAKLPEEAQTVVKSLAWNFGKGVDEALPTIWKAITQKDWAKVQDLLINTKWKQPELVARRKREAELLSRIA